MNHSVGYVCERNPWIALLCAIFISHFCQLLKKKQRRKGLYGDVCDVFLTNSLNGQSNSYNSSSDFCKHYLYIP